jgi:hypothetical protein
MSNSELDERNCQTTDVIPDHIFDPDGDLSITFIVTEATFTPIKEYEKPPLQTSDENSGTPASATEARPNSNETQVNQNDAQENGNKV